MYLVCYGVCKFSDVSSGTALNLLSLLNPSYFNFSTCRFECLFDPFEVRLSFRRGMFNSRPHSLFGFLDESFLRFALSLESNKLFLKELSLTVANYVES